MESPQEIKCEDFSEYSEDVVYHLLTDHEDSKPQVMKLAKDVAAAVHSGHALTEAIHPAAKNIPEEYKPDAVNGAAVGIEHPSHSKFPVKLEHLGFQTLTSSSHLPVVRPPSRTERLKTDAVAGGSAPPGSGAPSNENMEVDEEETSGEDDASECEDLRQDLEDALNDSNFSFTGSFYHANILTTAPNPCLHISGLGLVGLPLSERDAKAIVSCATLSPFGHGERTVVDKDVRDTWEIEPARIAFGNPEWLKYIDGVVCLEACKALGVAIENSPPKMELYKLLLYETGSHFLPHQDTQKANGMFATAVVILPSAYTGGQVVVSHGSITKTIDFAPNSLLSTTVLAWYTDVKHEVKPVTSGYRLALTYNLIHIASPGVSQPTLPQMGDSVDRLRQVLTKWREDKYAEAPEMPLMAYLLEHEYSSLNLTDGFKALNGPDAHLVTFLRDIAEELGYMVGLATLERHVSGPADDYGDNYYRRSRHHYYSDSYSDSYSEDEGDTPEMMEEEDRTTNIVGLVDLKGFSLLPFGKIEVEDDNLIPSDPFEGETPDKVEYEGYMGNSAGDVTHWYRHTVLVLMHKNDVDRVCFSVAGISYALQKLAALGAGNSLLPTADMKLWVDRIVSKSGRLNKEQALKMLDLAIKWKDANLFNTIKKSPMCALSLVDMDMLSRAWKIFSFEGVRTSFEQALARSRAFSEKLKLIYTVRSKTSNEDKPVVRSWCRKEIAKVLASYTQPEVKDIPVIMSVIRHSGWVPFVKILLPIFLKRPNTYTFLIAMIKALQEARQSLLDQLAKAKAIPKFDTLETEQGPLADAAGFKQEIAKVSQGDEKNIVDKVIEKALQAAAKQWSHAPSYGPYKYGTASSQNLHVAQTGKVERIVEIIDQAIIFDNLEICRTLFIDLLKNTGTSTEKFTQIYKPLVPRLRALLRSRNIDLCAPPFVDLIQILIGSYLRDVLGKRSQNLNPRLRKIGCGCRDCQALDKFLLDPTSQTTTFRLAQQRRTHLERQLLTASDLCTSVTIGVGSPHGLQMTKHPEVVQASTWEHRQKAARTFLSSIGTDEIIKKIMGVRYSDVVAAINGTTPFGATKGGDVPPASTPDVIPSARQEARRPAVVGATRSSHVGSSGPRIVSGSGATNLINRKTVVASSKQALTSAPPPQVAGKKRKNNPTVDLGVIDLT